MGRGEERLSHILVTGAAGFIGRALCGELVRRGHTVLGATRVAADPIAGVILRPVGNIGPHTDWAGHLDGVETVVHLATAAHRPVDLAAGTVEAAAAAALARAAGAAGARRLVHVSSIRAMGETTAPGRPFCAEDRPRPHDAYGRAKLAIEHALASTAPESGIDLVVLRPPLVYGPGVKGNFRALIGLAAHGLPLPFGGIDNRRNLIFLDNLTDLLATACAHPAAAGQVLLARDDTDVSTPELIRALASGLGRRARLFPVPSALFAAFRLVPGLRPALSRLTLSLQIDDAETRRILGWSPAVDPEAALSATASAFARRR
jgi:UDP-N-acetyl-alpha-D-quinovosamine dehydrogenase